MLSSGANRLLRIEQRGASLIEVLVAVVISTIGLLALAGVNAAALRYAKLSEYRATGAPLATDIAERMRANRAGVTGGGYSFTGSFSSQTSAVAVVSPACDSSGDTCTASELAAVDIYQWRRTVRSALPEGSVNLTYNATQVAADVYIAWRDVQVADSDETPAVAAECPNALSLGGVSDVRCLFFRVNL